MSDNDNTKNQQPTSEAGQSIVLITLVFVILLLFVGLAVDAGFGFVRSSQFSRAVDAAVLAGVVDLDPTSNDTDEADTRAGQFLGANGWPTPTLTLFDSGRSVSGVGIPQYTLTATWPVDLFFMRLLGISEFPITHRATGAFYAQAELYTPSAFDDGQIRRATQFVFGPSSCTQDGDPISPLESTPGNPNEDYILYEGVYRYRITIPDTYAESHVRVELFDPDSINLIISDTATVIHTRAVSDTLGASSPNQDCGLATGDGERCVILTSENLEAANQNPFWFNRVDETYTAGCIEDADEPDGDTDTTFELYYFDITGNKIITGTYTADNSEATYTDMRWVTPGVTPNVTANSGSFLVDVTGLPRNDQNFRFLQMDVRTERGSSKNVWDIWAGPPNSFYSNRGITPPKPDVNLRNLQMAGSPALYDREGILTLALGRMPLDSYVGDTEITLPLAPLEIEVGDGALYTSIFDYDTGTPPPDMIYEIDTVSTVKFKMCTSIVDAPVDATGNCGTPYEPLQATCEGDTDCLNNWTYPQYAMLIPGAEDSFFGGTLEVKYRPRSDTHTWSLAITAGRPFLTE